MAVSEMSERGVNIIKHQTKSTTSDMPAHSVHIADLFFQEEISRAAGHKAGHLWFSENRNLSRRCSQQRDSREYTRTIQSVEEVSCSNTLQSCSHPIIIDSEMAEGLGDRFGLLFTDAAHAVLCDFERQHSLP